MKYKKLFLIALLLAPTWSFADTPDFQLLTSIPGISDPNNLDFGKYINILYMLAIALAALLAVIKIIIAGIKWMMTDIVTSKQDAKDDIWGATMGLLLILAAVLFLSIINPNIVNFNLFDSDGGVPTVNITYANKPAPTPGSSQKESAVQNTQVNKDICEGPQFNGKFHNDGTFSSNGGPTYGWCIMSHNLTASNFKKEEYGCTQNSGTYDCTDAKNECTNAGGTPATAYALNGTTSLPYKIKCN